MKTKVCPKCLVDELGCWLADTNLELVEDTTEYDQGCLFDMAWQGIFMLDGALGKFPQSYFCEIHQKDEGQQMELFRKEVMQSESAH